jgi:phage-related protein
VTAPLAIKPLIWIGRARADLSAFPEDVKDSIGFALYMAQQGSKHINAKPLRGFRGASVLEIVDDYAGETYRLVYTVQFTGRIYALHAFHKKSKTGIKTPKSELDLIQARLRQAMEEHARWLEHQRGKSRNG